MVYDCMKIYDMWLRENIWYVMICLYDNIWYVIVRKYMIYDCMIIYDMWLFENIWYLVYDDIFV